MKLTIFLLTTLFFQANAMNSYAQKINLKAKNGNLIGVLEKIASQSGYDFIYGNTPVNAAKPVTVSLRNEDIESALKKVFANQQLSYAIRNKTVVLFKKESSFLDRVADFFQTTTITGKVVDENNVALPGVTVQLKGSSVLARTNSNGNYSITVPERNAVLVFSYIGFGNQEINVGSSSMLNVQMKVNAQILEETVIVAYGIQKKTDVTGSLTTISGQSLRDLPSTINIEQSLQGQAAGVMVLQESGQPGGATRVRIRGTSSLLGSNQPLYVVDGVPVVAEGNIPDTGTPLNTALLQQGLNSPLNNLNPDDIESLTVLKDASATAIYGSRAANGVVLITTKKGSLQKGPTYNFSSSVSTQGAQTQEVLNAAQFKELWTEAANNSTSTVLAVQQIKNGTYFKDSDTDWEKEVSPSAPLSRNLNVSASGATERTNYYVSLGTTRQDGTFDNSGFERYNLMLNLDFAASRNIKLGTSINLSSSSQDTPEPTLLTRIYTFRPDMPVYNPDGTYTFSEGYTLENPVALSKATNKNNTDMAIASAYAEVTLARDFKLRSVLSINYNNGKQKSYYPSQTARGGWARATGEGTGYAQQSSTQFLSHLWENTLTYNHVFEDIHSVEAIAGASWQGDTNELLFASGMGFPQDDILNNLTSATSNFMIKSGGSQTGLVSFFGRANYSYKSKYILGLSARTDGSSKFATENKWAFFPTVSAAWRLSEENFLKDASFLNELKLRASTGLTGQQAFGPYEWRTLFLADQYGGVPAVVQNQIGNSRLKWELTTQTDIGLDFSFFKGRLNGSADYYVKDTKDLLFTVLMPGSSGFSTAVSNLGRSQNKGFELSLESDIFRTKGFSWNLSVNFARNSNKLISLNSDFFNASTGLISPPSTGYNLKIGQPFGLIYGRVAEGIIQSQAELDALNALAPDGVYQNVNTRPGDIRFKDLNGDGKVNSLDQDIIGNALPKYSGGFTNTFRYKDLSLSALFTYVGGNDIRWGTMATNANFTTVGGGENKLAIALDRWTPEKPSTTIPRAVYGDPNSNALISSFYVHDGSYLRLKNLSLNYQLPRGLLAKTGFLKSVQINASATNLLTFTKYPGLNPETTNLFNNDLSAGLDNSRFPIAKVYTLGLRAGF